MFDCHKDVLAHHDEAVKLPEPERTAMRTRRDSNRTRLAAGLSKANEPSPYRHRSQGSYAMKTMVQHPLKDYDIDDGAYFKEDVLVGDRGGEMTPLQVRQMVRDALDDSKFKVAPVVKTNCVRVQYDAGYHVDVPVYRRVVTLDFLNREVEHFELASASWVRSDAVDVTAWFDGQNTTLSADGTNDGQLRRVVRAIKRFANSRATWKGSILSGFGITKLVTECYRGNATREDEALRETMRAIRDRLVYNLVVSHPCTPGATITTGSDDARARYLREKLSDALRWLEPLDAWNCDRADALACWDKVYSTTFFSERDKSKSEQVAKASVSASVITGLAASNGAMAAISKEGGGRYA